MHYLKKEIVNAVPATYADFLMEVGEPFSNDKEENEVSGYIVETVDGSKKFIDSRELNESYVPYETFEDRMNVELNELKDRLDKLDAFLNSPNFEKNIPDGEMQGLLKRQYVAMKSYQEVLLERFSKIKS